MTRDEWHAVLFEADQFMGGSATVLVETTEEESQDA